MRRMLTSLALVLAVTLAACGNGDDANDDPATPTATALAPPAPTTGTPPADVEWDGQLEVDFDTGEVSAPGFNDLVDAQSPDWAEEPLSAASVLVHLDEAEGTVETEQETEGGDPVVVVTISGLFDDSIEAVRYRLVFTPGDDGLHRFAAGQWSQRCQPDRGHQDFQPAPCL